MPLSVNIEKKDEQCIITTLAGPLDTITYRIFEDKTRDTVGHECKAVVLDMEGVNYISSMGLSVVLRLRKKVETAGGELTLTNLQPKIRKVFEVSKIIPDLIAFKSRIEADMYLDKIQREEE